MTASETLLLDYIMKHTRSCPLKDDAEIDFEKECVGYREVGCKQDFRMQTLREISSPGSHFPRRTAQRKEQRNEL